MDKALDKYILELLLKNSELRRTVDELTKRLDALKSDSEATEKAKSSILGEEWTRGVPTIDNDERIINKSGMLVAIIPSTETANQIAALPDALRALVMVRDSVIISKYEIAVRNRVSAEFSENEWKTIEDVLKKAGVI